jgi:hypothetical protein
MGIIKLRMDKNLIESLDVCHDIAKELQNCVQTLNNCLIKANEAGMYVLLQKDESYDNQISLTITRASYTLHFIKDDRKSKTDGERPTDLE